MWKNPKIRQVVLTTADTSPWTVPVNFVSLISVECWGGASGGNATPGTTHPAQVSKAGGEGRIIIRYYEK